jgi:hypothetical protein
MPIIIEANYSKKIGLPAYSSHAFSVTIRTEISDVSDVQRQAGQLYALLQESVDRNIQEVGFSPEGNGHASHTNGEAWACSDKQRDLILKIVDEHRLDKQEVEALAKDLFQKPVKVLNKLEASGLIEELLNKYGPTQSKGSNGNGRHQYQRGGARQ